MSPGQPELHAGAVEGERFPCSPYQKRVWRERTGRRGGTAQNAAFRWRLNGPIRQSTIETALQLLTARYEPLRTGFTETAGEVVQVVAPHAAIELNVFDLALLSSDEKEARARTVGEAEARRPFALNRAPLARATLVRTDRDVSILHLTFHSLIMDGWSVGILIREFGELCDAIEADEIPATETPDLQFGDYVLWQRAMLEEGALDEARAYWTRQLAGVPRFDVAPDRENPATASNNGDIRSILLPTATTEKLDSFCRQAGQTRFTVAAAALAIVLHRVTGAGEVVLGTQVAGRSETMMESIVGPLLNTLPLRLHVDPGHSSSNLLKTTGETVRDALAHQGLPFEEMPGVSDVHDDRSPLYSVNLVVQNAYIDKGQVADTSYGALEIASLRSFSAGALWDLSFFMVGRVEGWRISCEADADLFDPASVDHFLAQWAQAILMVIDNADTPLERLGAFVDMTPRAKTAPLALTRNAARPAKRTDPAARIAWLQRDGDLTPVIAINNVSVYHHVAMAIGKQRPFADLQFFDPEGDRDLPRRAFEDFAADAVRLIRLARPRGPYILAGLCVYGSIAFEAARQLQREGEKVECVVVFDGWAPGYRELMPFHDRMLRQLQLRLSEFDERVERHERNEMSFGEAYYLNGFLRKFGLAPPAPMPTPKISTWFDEALRVSHIDYRPKPYDGDVVVFRSDEPLSGRLFDHALGWGALTTRPVPVFHAPGKHIEIFRVEGARAIGDALRSVLKT